MLFTSYETRDAKKVGWFPSFCQSIANLDVELALEALKDRLMTKNVAKEIAEELCKSVAVRLEGQKTASFDWISSTVQAAMEDALVPILTPRPSIDIVRDVCDAKEQRKPYVVVFMGVNGVGKSTILAKVAFRLLQFDMNVMMAASGSDTSLHTHAKRLGIPIFEKGCWKGPAIAAKEAIQEATLNGSDVRLVDTPGVMQDNETSMGRLAELVYLNGRDLILFVGEAKYGNDALDQLTMFNQHACRVNDP